MSFVTEWIAQLIFLVLFATILELLLPNSQLQRYVRLVIGLIILVVMLQPVFYVFQMSADEWLDSLDEWSGVGEENSADWSMEEQKSEIESNQLAYISEQMAVQLQKQANDQEVLDEMDKHVTDVSIVLAPTLIEEDENDVLGNIEMIEVTVSDTSAEGEDSGNEDGEIQKIEKVETVKVDTSQSFTEEGSETKGRGEDGDKKDLIRKRLEDVWQIPSERITVVGKGESSE
ncbi:stage III sporulation protein AF [Texcoconibacillus texcoconensis]|uniref:Stage III sporulation protein AF n=1 Tax=Texcoconibacillus texcoconensis TaxID=1095777 RepID=A0A840QP00_9BACI|nr:stage III sporulation protein AF [Texcoconibacillus texcoconensis]